MCVSYVPAEYDDLALHWAARYDFLGLPADPADFERHWALSIGAVEKMKGDESVLWPAVSYQDYPAPFITRDADGTRVARMGTFGMVPGRRIPKGVKHFSTMNARTETIDNKRNYAKYWRQQSFCLIPIASYYEPCWESGKAIRWELGLKGGMPFAVAGLWRSWPATDKLPEQYTFTMLTMNCDEHPLLNRMHKPPKTGESPDKRSLIVILRGDYDAWLTCDSEEKARSFFNLVPAEDMYGNPNPLKTKKTKELGLAPVPKRKAPTPPTSGNAPEQLDLLANIS